MNLEKVLKCLKTFEAESLVRFVVNFPRNRQANLSPSVSEKRNIILTERKAACGKVGLESRDAYCMELEKPDVIFERIKAH